MGETPGEPPTQSEAKTCPGDRGRSAVLVSGLAKPRHAHKDGSRAPFDQWAVRPSKTVRMYRYGNRTGFGRQSANSTFLLGLCPRCTIGGRRVESDPMLRQVEYRSGGLWKALTQRGLASR